MSPTHLHPITPPAPFNGDLEQEKALFQFARLMVAVKVTAVDLWSGFDAARVVNTGAVLTFGGYSHITRIKPDWLQMGLGWDQVAELCCVCVCVCFD